MNHKIENQKKLTDDDKSFKVFVCLMCFQFFPSVETEFNKETGKLLKIIFYVYLSASLRYIQ